MRNRVGGIVIRDKKILLVSTDGSWYWTPGGKIELGEEEVPALRRELLEELQIEPIEIELYNRYEVATGETVAGYSVKGGNEINYLVIISSDIVPSAEIKFANWYTGSEAMKLSTLDSFKKNVISRLIEDDLL